MSAGEYIGRHPLNDTQIARNEQTELALKMTAHVYWSGSKQLF